MEFGFSAEQDMLRETARRFLSDKAQSDVVRSLMETESGFDEALWDEVAAQGWQAMAIPEKYGGAGFSFMEMAILMEEMGRSLFPSPYLSSVILGAGLIEAYGTEEQKEQMLAGIADGSLRVAVAQLEESGRWDAGGVTLVARRDGSDVVLDGQKSFVVDGHTAHTLLVVAREEDTEGEEGITLVAVSSDSPGVDARRIETMDMTRKQAEISFTNVRVSADAVIGVPGEAWPAVSEMSTRAVIALAFEQIGGAEHCLEMSVEYAKERVQFGRPIGSFQAIKHRCADMLVQLESAKSAAFYAGWVATEGDSDLGVAAALAKSACSEAFFRCAADNIQIHGGIGFTWEHDAHLYFKRAKTDELLFGTPTQHRKALAAHLGV